MTFRQTPVLDAHVRKGERGAMVFYADRFIKNETDADGNRDIRENVFCGFVYNALGMPIAARVLYPVVALLLTPIIASAAMTFSSVSVSPPRSVFAASRCRLHRDG